MQFSILSPLSSKKEFIALRAKTLLTLLHSKRPKLYGVLAFLSAIGLRANSAGPHRAVHSTSDSRVRGPELDTPSGHIF